MMREDCFQECKHKTRNFAKEVRSQDAVVAAAQTIPVCCESATVLWQRSNIRRRSLVPERDIGNECRNTYKHEAQASVCIMIDEDLGTPLRYEPATRCCT
ncbi:MAG TPA: hypothetical protein DD473_01745 [Planctomycetaceae bacterium]|nr:hypothetical protein [Planctomycetaceae bacterium]